MTFQSGSSYVDQGFLIRYESFIPSDRKTSTSNVFLRVDAVLQRCLMLPYFDQCCSSACPKQFRCSSNLCINTTLQCDGWNDCGDNSDEMSCSESHLKICCRATVCSGNIYSELGMNDGHKQSNFFPLSASAQSAGSLTLSAKTACVSPRCGRVMDTMTVETELMRRTAVGFRANFHEMKPYVLI